MSVHAVFQSASAPEAAFSAAARPCLEAAPSQKPNSALSSCATASAHATKATMPVTAPNRTGAAPVTAPAIAEVTPLDLVIVAAHVEFETIRLGKQHDGRAGQTDSVRQHRYCNRAVLPAGGLQAKGRLSFKTGVFGAIEPPKTARRSP